MRSILRFVYPVYKWLIFFPTLIVSTCFFGFCAAIAAICLNPRIASISGVIWARFNSAITPMLVNVEGRENIVSRNSYVIVSNHQSLYDIFVLYGWLGVDFKWVMKKELRKVPALGIACEKIGHIYIDRSDSKAAIRTIREASERIRNGTSVIFFPEGTRSRSGKLGPFKKGAFNMAMDLKLPILPVTIIGTREIMPPQSLRLYPGKARMVIHPPIPVIEYSRGQLPELMERARAALDPATIEG